MVGKVGEKEDGWGGCSRKDGSEDEKERGQVRGKVMRQVWRGG